jgi:hypothetical protein
VDREDLRIGDAERDETTAALREHFAQGRLTREELDERLDLALTARTAGELARVATDLPAPPGRAPGPRPRRTRGPRPYGGALPPLPYERGWMPGQGDHGWVPGPHGLDRPPRWPPGDRAEVARGDDGTGDGHPRPMHAHHWQAHHWHTYHRHRHGRRFHPPLAPFVVIAAVLAFTGFVAFKVLFAVLLAAAVFSLARHHRHARFGRTRH